MKVLWLHTGSINCEPILGSLEAQAHPDYELWAHNYFEDPDIIRAVTEVEPDLTLYLSVVAGPSLPKLADLRSIKNVTNFVHICCDAGCKDWWPLLEQYAKADVFDLTVNLDGNYHWPKHHNHLTMLCPIDPRYYNNLPWEDRVIDLGFSGGNGSLERRIILDELGERVTQKPRDEQWGSYQAYADFMSRTKICLNMSSTGPNDAKQVKARVIEAAHAGCCLFEQKGSPIDKYFTEGVHYATYENENDVVSKVNQLFANPERAKQLASNLSKEVQLKYSAHIFWKTVFEYVQLPW